MAEIPQWRLAGDWFDVCRCPGATVGAPSPRPLTTVNATASSPGTCATATTATLGSTT